MKNHLSNHRSAKLVCLACLFACVLSLVGCKQAGTSLHIRDYRDDGRVVQYVQPFTQVYYDINSAGELDVVLREEVPAEGNPNRSIEQIVHIQSIWLSRYAQTSSEEGQISGDITYAIVDGANVSIYAGIGSTHFRHYKKKDIVRGSIGQAVLNIRSGGIPVFRRAEVKGTFVAQRNRREVVRLTNLLKRYLADTKDRRVRSH